jgi:Concanavalin A-like lectin/glucanases superfamily
MHSLLLQMKKRSEAKRVAVSPIRKAIVFCLVVSGALLGLLVTNNAVVQTCAPPPPNMVSWWPGDGNANDIKDGNNGTLQNGATFATGMVDQAFLLDGIDDFVDVGNAPNLQVSPSEFTVDAWVNFNALSHPPGENNGAPPGDMSILDKMSPSGVNTDGWRLIKQDDNRFWFCFGAGGDNGCGDPAFTVFSQTEAVTGADYHVSAVKTSTTFSIYVNGVLEDTRALPSFTDSNSTDLLIGANSLEGAHLNGLIDEVEIFNRALSASEIQGIVNAGSAGKCKASYAAQIQQPINSDGSSVFNVRRGVVPVKFTLTQDGTPTCALPPATIAVTRTAGGTTGAIDESIYTGSADTGSNFRINGCQYIYNLTASALGVGTYRVDIKINGQVVGSAVFQLK